MCEKKLTEKCVPWGLSGEEPDCASGGGENHDGPLEVHDDAIHPEELGCNEDLAGAAGASE